MMTTDVKKRTLGISFTNDETERNIAHINVWAPLKKEVAIVLKDGESIPLSGDEYGYWTAETLSIQPGSLYKVSLGGAEQFPDPVSLSQPEGVHGFSQAVDTSVFEWTDEDWQNVPLKDFIVYELHTGTFSPNGTFIGLEEKLDYLKMLGITAIEIMPVAQFPGERNWGYDGVFPFAVQDSYGGVEGLQHLINTCHQKGIAVILDVVYNHLGPEGNYLGAYGPYFTNKYGTPWGEALNFDDAWCDGVRRYFIENALMWFRDFHIDALRLDAVHAIKDFSPSHILRDIRLHVDALMEQTGREHYLIAECDLNDTRFINPVDKGGYGMDAQWIDEFHHSLRISAGGERNGYYSDFEGIGHLAKAFRDAYVYDGQYSPHRHKHFGTKTEFNTGQQFVVFSQNHDQVGNRMLGERTSQLNSFEMQKLLAGAVLLSPYVPMLFMGEEWSEPHPFLYFVSHTDPELAEAVRKGRKAEFAAFHALGEAPDPMAVETFKESKLQWDLQAQEPHATMLHYYKTLINLRKTHPALSVLDRKSLDVFADEKANTLVLHRWNGNGHVLALMNFSKQATEVPVPYDVVSMNLLLNSSGTEWKGAADAPPFIEKGMNVSIPAESLLVYTNDHV